MKTSKLFKIRDAMNRGARLGRMHGKHRQEWFLIPGGPVEEKLAIELISMPDIIGEDDGLFPGLSQTYRRLRHGE
jgi:hypothetical protein